MNTQKEINGPPIYLNWIAKLRGERLQQTTEFPLYSDAHIVGETDYGPYQFLHTVPIPLTGVVQPILVLRCDWHWSFPNPDFSKTDANRYHGGAPPEEIAALMSLALGIRVRAGESMRIFIPGDDPKGTPRAWARHPEPTLMINSGWHQWVLPHAALGQHSVEALHPFAIIPNLNPEDAISLVRAARSFQDALWIAETEPELSWLLIISALETAANHWRSQKDAPVSRMQASKPDLYDYLVKLGDPNISIRVAEEIADSLGSTKKFVDFVLNFLPPEPTERPGFGRIDWSNKSLEKILKVIYGYRSKALHEGRPFPAPMCAPPFQASESSAPIEKPLGATSQGTGTWLEKDIPILLHMFEYIARGSLVNWWLSMNTVNTRS